MIHTLYGMEDKGLRDGDSVEYFQDFLRRMHDLHISNIQKALTRKVDETLVLFLLVFFVFWL